MFSIGASGQLYIAGTLTAWVGFSPIFAGLPPFLHIPLAIIAGVIGGALWGAIPGALKAYTGAHEVINTIMLNFVAIRLVDWLIKSTDPVILLDETASLPRTPYINTNAQLPSFDQISPLLFVVAGIAVAAWDGWRRRGRTPNNPARPVIIGLITAALGFFLGWISVRSNLHVGLIIMVLIVWLTDWFLTRTTVGFELRAVGANADAARYAGMNVKWNVILAMTLSGALAGLAGAVEIAGVKYTMQPDFFANLGFDAIAVALLARTEPRSMIWAGFLWGGLLAGANLMQVRANISIDLVLIIQALIIMFIAADQIIRYLWRVPEATLEEKQAATLARGWSG
jgi:simple sugar transport system permease protein